MAPKSTNKPNHVHVLKEQIEAFQREIKERQEQILSIQKSCDHEFLETPVMRTCKKCQFAESVYY